MTIKESGVLLYGVEYEGKIHYDFEMRLPTVEDNIAAIELVGAASNLRVNSAMYARCITKLGTIPPDAITYQFITANMVDDDYDVLHNKVQELKKKRRASNTRSPTSDSLSSSSGSTDSLNPASVS
ncbi:hypothetical protein KY49_3290 [Burkholderia sp. MSHR3999]|uniref:hypothetical protein n=1 Tax=Burkholderia sp. MSHR3999 TaxID=1542965 RepID=UPI0005ABECDB|nr:hypothetical protein [Burkholderia sp. MSHR3999]KIP18748.1 hypothetical protein KY49_3290 [Burkholderia sp. MSHR3999]